MQEHRASLAPPTTGGCEQTICSVHNHQTPEAGTELGLTEKSTIITSSLRGDKKERPCIRGL